MEKIIGKLLFVGLLLALVLFPAFGGGQQEAQKEVELVWPCIWVGQDSKAGVIEELVEEFNDMHQGEVQVVIEPQYEYRAYENNMRTRLAVGDAPDIFTLNWSPDVIEYYGTDLLMDFSKELAKDGWKDNFNKNPLVASTIDGRIETLPYEMGLAPIWYNINLFNKAGIEKFPETMDDFWEACEKLKAIDVVPVSLSTNSAWVSMLWYSHFMGSLGGPDVWESDWDDPAYVKAAEILKRMFSDGNTTEDAIMSDPNTAGSHYMAERTAMFTNGAWYIGDIRDNAPEIHKATRLASVPKAGDYHGHQLGWLHTNLVAANTDDPVKRAAVVKFFKYLTEPNNIRRLSLASGSLFAVEFEFREDDDIDPLQRRFVEAANEATFLIQHMRAVKPNDVYNEMQHAIGEMVAKDSSPERFVEMLQNAAN